MGTYISKQKQWKEWLTNKLTAAGVFEEFTKVRIDLARHLNATTGQSGSTLDAKAWKQAAAMYSDHFDIEEFDNYRRRSLIMERAKRQERHNRRIKKMTPPKKKTPKLTDEQLSATLQPVDEEVVFIHNGVEGDILGDTKWVYQNLARLIIAGKGGIRVLDTKVLKEAPSNGAVGLARYALDDPKAFFEKFVTKILPKDDNPTRTGPTDEELKAELDPTFDDLAKYMKKIEKNA